jgi:ribosome modulation factor
VVDFHHLNPEGAFMFMFTADLPAQGSQMLVAVLEESDLPKLGDGKMLVVKPKVPEGQAALNIVQVGIYFTRQTQEQFIDEMRKGGQFAGITFMDNRIKPSKFATPYEQGIKARTEFEALTTADPEKLCPYQSGPWRDYWLTGWRSADQRAVNDAIGRAAKGGEHGQATE